MYVIIVYMKNLRLAWKERKTIGGHDLLASWFSAPVPPSKQGYCYCTAGVVYVESGL
jgi:hypothetical protein